MSSSDTATSSPPSDPSPAVGCLAGERVVLLGKLSGMNRREACALIRQRGGTLLSEWNAEASLAVLGDNYPDLASALGGESAGLTRLSEAIQTGQTQLIRESKLWQQLGLVDSHNEEPHAVQRLYTPAMLAELLAVPVAAIRRWHRQGFLQACRNVRKLPYFDFAEVGVARHLADLFQAGCSLAVIERKLAELSRALPNLQRPLADPALVVVGRQLILRQGDVLAEPSGQQLIDFDQPELEEDTAELIVSIDEPLPFAQSADVAWSSTLSTLEELQFEALRWEDQGELQKAADAYRTLLMAGGPTAELHFALADLLYRLGDLSAARERFYAAIELDEEYVEARANLGCVLAERGELELAVAAFEGALAFHDDYADVHFHLANVLDRLERQQEAQLHWRTFLSLAPESPWADAARNRLGEVESESEILSLPFV